MCRAFTWLTILLTLALTSTASAGTSHDPKGVHLSFGASDTTMVVTWTTRKETETNVRYGPSDSGGATPADLSINAIGDARKFVDYGSTSSVRYVHVATLEGLTPGQRYEYQVGDAKLDRWSKVFWFNAKRTAEQYAEGSPLRIIALCDIGFKESDSVVELLTQEVHGEQPPDALVQCGDFAYDLDDENGGVGDQFMKAMEPIAAYVPWMTSAGNHEASHNFTHYRERFEMPDRSKTDNHYYSIDVGPVHIVAYNTEALFWPASFGVEYIQRMYEWMEADLASVDRMRTPWVVVHGHRPMYCPEYRELEADELASGERKPLGEYSEDEDEDAVTIGGFRRGYRKFLRGTLGKKKKKWKGGMCPWEQESSRKGVPSFCEAADGTSCAFNENAAFLQSGKDARDGVGHALRFPIEDLFYKYGVDLAFYGHEHEYWRTFPVYDEKVVNGTDVTLDRYFEPRGTVHVTTGSGGNKEMLDARRVAKEALNGTTYPPTRGRCADVVGAHRAVPWCAFTSGFAPKASRGETSDFTFSRVVVRSDAVLTWEQVSAGDPSDDHEGAGDPLVIDAFTIVAPTHGAFARLKGRRRDDAAFAAR